MNSVAQIGDSITQGAGTTDTNGWRKALYEHCVAEGYNVDFVGTRSNGTFPENQHDGEPNAQVDNRVAFITANYGAGKTFLRGKVVLLMSGTNDVRQAGYDLNVSMANKAAELAAARAAWPDATIAVMNILAIDAATDALAAGRVAAFNAALVDVWDTDDAAHPTNELVRIDAHGAVGPWDSGTFFDAYHPNDTGAALLAAVIIAALDPHLS